MIQTRRTTYASIALGLAGFAMLFLSACSGGDEDCASNEVNTQEFGCLTQCDTTQQAAQNACGPNETCTPLPGGGTGGACEPEQPDPDTDTTEPDAAPDVGTTGLSCFEFRQCNGVKCSRPGASESCEQTQRDAMSERAQLDQDAFNTCLEETCSTECGEQGSTDACNSCVNNSCDQRLFQCVGVVQPPRVQTCGDLIQCLQACQGQRSCVDQNCTARSQEMVDRVNNFISCQNNALGFPESSGDAGTSDSGMQTMDSGMMSDASMGDASMGDAGQSQPSCSQIADDAGNDNGEVEDDVQTSENNLTEAELESQCYWERCGTAASQCFGCQ